MAELVLKSAVSKRGENDYLVVMFINQTMFYPRDALFVNYAAPFIHGMLPYANNESSEVFDIIKAGRRVKIKGYRQ